MYGVCRALLCSSFRSSCCLSDGRSETEIVVERAVSLLQVGRAKRRRVVFQPVRVDRSPGWLRFTTVDEELLSSRQSDRCESVRALQPAVLWTFGLPDDVLLGLLLGLLLWRLQAIVGRSFSVAVARDGALPP